MHYPKKHYDVTVVVWKGTIPFKKADPWVDHAWTYSRQMSDSSSFLDLQNHLIGPAKKSPSLKFKPSFNNTSSFALHNWIWLFPNWKISSPDICLQNVLLYELQTAASHGALDWIITRAPEASLLEGSCWMLIDWHRK